MTTENKTTYAADDLDAIRNQLAETSSGPEYWRSLEEVAQTDTFKSYISNEFHMDADSGQALGSVSRRNFLQVMGASLALAGVTAGCSRQPIETIHPYVRQPEEFIPGKPTYFASTHVNGGYANGVLIESHMGRPTKVEGLPSHPASLGRTSAQTQASILDMYDPDRTKTVEHNGGAAAWDDFVTMAKSKLDDARPSGGAGIRLLTGSITSPLEAAKIEQFLAANPRAQWHQYEAFGRDNEREGAKLAFDQYLDTILHFDDADIVVALDSDVFEQGPAQVRYAADYAKRRNVEDFDEPFDGGHGEGHGEEAAESHGDDHEEAAESHEEKPEFHAKSSRTYAFESSPTLLGAMADHRFPVRPSQIEDIARVLADKLGVNDALPSGTAEIPDKEIARIDAIVKDLQSKKGRSIITVGSTQPAAVHALAHAMNAQLNNTGATVDYIEPVEAGATNQLASLKALRDDMDAGNVSLLMISGDVNPVYSAPADFEFAAAMDKVETRVRHGRYVDETAQLCQWQLPELHYLETWGDARAFDGSVSLIQPLIAPLYRGKSRVELLSALTDELELTSHEQLQAQYKAQWGLEENDKAFDIKWRTALASGMIDRSASSTVNARLSGNGFGAYAGASTLAEMAVEVIFLADPSVGDGSFSNNAWMQEVPNPLTKLTWDNAVLVGYSTAKKHKLKNEQEVEITVGGRTIKGAVWIQPGHASDTITLHGGYGRTSMGKVCEVSEGYLGFDAYSVRSSDHTFASHGSVKPLNSVYKLARTEEHYNMEGRGLV
ncbi:MAG: TAT-variant-translocated molybdopterin oxidoreductase, partial [Candidatus Hydrogenedentota bacterium]